MDRLHGRMDNFAPSAAAVGLLVRDDRSAPGVWSDDVRSGAAATAGTACRSGSIASSARSWRSGASIHCAPRARPRAMWRRPTRWPGEFSASPWTSACSARAASHCSSAPASNVARAGWRWKAIPRAAATGCAARWSGSCCSWPRPGAFAGQERNRHYFVICDERLNGALEQANGEFRLVYGYQSRHGAARQAWLVVHRAGGSQTRPVSLNQLASPRCWPSCR